MRSPRVDLPTGTVVFFRTDVEGSMRHALALGPRWDELNEWQQKTIRNAVEEAGGTTVRTEGDSVFAVFPDAPRSIRAAIASQKALIGRTWPTETPVRVRIGLHAGEAHLAGDDYGGFDVNRAARIAAVGHGGQIILSGTVRSLVEDDLPDGVTVRDLGRHEIRDIPRPELLFQLDVPGLETEFPPLRTTAPTTGNLPLRMTTFVGRERDVVEIGRLLDESRLVTIHGPGGIGKTSLATEVARSRLPSFADGVWFVALDSVTEPHLVMTEVTRTLGLYDGPDRPAVEGVARHFAERSALLILDNFEQVIGAASQIPPLLQQAPGLRLLVTSRAPLRVGGEQAYPVGPLRSDGEESAATQLFEDRARSVLPSWEPGDDEPIVAEICHRLDGLPLGIELAAARVALLPPAVIRDRLVARLPLPGSGPRDLPERQQTLEATIAWSYELLPANRQRLLQELSVFDGGFDIEQVRRVASRGDDGDGVLDALLELADQSLILRPAGYRPGTGGLRFDMLETIRSFAMRKLAAGGTADDVRRRQAEAFAELAEGAAPRILGLPGVAVMDRLREDHANFATAVRWSIEQSDVRLAQRLTGSLWRYWQQGGFLREGRELCDAVVAMPGADEPSPGRLWSLAAAGGMAYWQADMVAAAQAYRLQLETAEQIGDRAGEADAAWNLAAAAWIQGSEGAESLVDRAQRLYETIGDQIGAARTEWGKSVVLAGEGRFDEAMHVTLAARERYAALDDTYYLALTEGHLAFIYGLRGEFEESLRWGRNSIRDHHAMRDVATTTLSLAVVAILSINLRLLRTAATLMAAYEALCGVHGVRPPAGLELMMASQLPLERLTELMSAEDMQAAVDRGRRMTLDEAVEFALAETSTVIEAGAV